ncbi:MAG: undecaprenyl-phosphate glucose phosphotransferase [Minwuia sp.]|uniref:undecaprenyl-phosphate glucose phosphotransferase n=1 Tax=Minwuia sp. TaxID=2493630 RepID=UPI003A8AD4D2
MSTAESNRSRRVRKIASPAVLVGLARVADLALITFCGWLAYTFRHDSLILPGTYVVAIVVAMAVAANAFQIAGLYRFERLDQIGGQIGRLAVAWTGVSLALLAISFFSKTSADYSRIWVGLWLVFSFFGLATFRIATAIAIQSWRQSGVLSRNVVVVGAGLQGERLIRHIQDHKAELGVNVLAVFTLRQGAGRSDVLGVPVKGGLRDLLLYVRNNHVEEIMVALPWDREDQIADVLKQLREAPIDVSLAPEPLGYRLMERRVRHLGDLPMTVVQEEPLSGWNYILKGLEDRILSALIILAISPLLLAIAVLIRLDSPGPAIFRQQRYGFNNNVFTVYKFRSMRNDAGDARGGAQATKGDPRITRIGAFIRKTSLDELPQLFNVLKGDMSLVGPRPHAVAHNEEYAEVIDEYLSRHKVKPGITGWAQIHGLRGETDTREKMEMRVQYDLYYIDNWSLWLDFRILLRTLMVGFVNENAY